MGMDCPQILKLVAAHLVFFWAGNVVDNDGGCQAPFQSSRQLLHWGVTLTWSAFLFLLEGNHPALFYPLLLCRVHTVSIEQQASVLSFLTSLPQIKFLHFPAPFQQDAETWQEGSVCEVQSWQGQKENCAKWKVLCQDITGYNWTCNAVCFMSFGHRLIHTNICKIQQTCTESELPGWRFVLWKHFCDCKTDPFTSSAAQKFHRCIYWTENANSLHLCSVRGEGVEKVLRASFLCACCVLWMYRHTEDLLYSTSL